MPRDMGDALKGCVSDSLTGSRARPSLAALARRGIRAGRAPAGGQAEIPGLQRRTEIDLAPWRMICRLEVRFEQGAAVGSGWLAGPRTVITAGHCLFNPRLGGRALEARVTPGHDQELSGRFGAAIGQRFEMRPEWTEQGLPAFDFGAIHLDQPLGERTGTLRFAALEDAAFVGRWANVAGYPLGAPWRGAWQMHHAAPFDAPGPMLLTWPTETAETMSGGPVFMAASAASEPVVVGIHRGAAEGGPQGASGGLGEACRITEERYNLIQSWIVNS